MSMDSPVKRHRTERHLMRQRGAGVRTVAANFGFSIGHSSQPSSSINPSPTRQEEEPIAKRRDTSLNDKPEKFEDPAYRSTKRSVRSVKKRKRFEVVDDDVGRPEDDGDSFIATMAKKRKKNSPGLKKAVVRETNVQKTTVQKETQQSAIREQETKPAVPADTGRPKRRAATAAVRKVTDGFAEESASIDKKRRNQSPPRTSRTSTAKVKEHPDEVPAAGSEIATKNEQAKTSRPTGRRRKANHIEPDIEQPDDQLFTARNTKAATRSKQIPKSQRKKRTAHTVSRNVDEQDELSTELFVHGEGALREHQSRFAMQLSRDDSETRQKEDIVRTVPPLPKVETKRLRNTAVAEGELVQIDTCTKDSTKRRIRITSTCHNDASVTGCVPDEEHDSNQCYAESSTRVGRASRSTKPAKSSRPPLAAADVNAVIRSSSPDKPDAQCRTNPADRSIRHPPDTRRDSASTESAHPETSGSRLYPPSFETQSSSRSTFQKKARLEVQHCDQHTDLLNVITESTSAYSPSKSESYSAPAAPQAGRPLAMTRIMHPAPRDSNGVESQTCGFSDVSVQDAAKAPSETNDVPVAAATGLAPAARKGRSWNDEVREDVEIKEGSEDVEWLVDDRQSVLQKPKPSMKSVRKPSTLDQDSEKRRPKLADIDLDDVISRIAAFAKVETTARSADGS